MDFITVFWKEWKEILSERLKGRSIGGRNPLFLIAILGLFMPWRMGAAFFNPRQLLIFVFLPMVIIAMAIADSFAGERERHTLETLLASRLPDQAILLGKIAAALSYGWVIAMLCLLSGVIVVNVFHGKGKLLFFDGHTVLAILLLAPLTGALMATAGVLVSLRASTVRQAQQTLMTSFMIVIFAIIFGSRSLPAAWQASFGHAVATWGATSLILAAAAVLLILDLLLLAAATARFQRSRLVLD